MSIGLTGRLLFLTVNLTKMPPPPQYDCATATKIGGHNPIIMHPNKMAQCCGAPIPSERLTRLDALFDLTILRKSSTIQAHALL